MIKFHVDHGKELNKKPEGVRGRTSDSMGT